MPSFAELLAFEAVARLGSFTEAAEELALTQGAVSKQVGQLEATLGVRLFDRTKRQAKINGVGQQYVNAIRSTLSKLERSTTAIIASHQEPRVINLAVSPCFSARWLAPRLGAFARANPSVTVNCKTYFEPFDFDDDVMDLAVHVGQANWAGTTARRLFNEIVVAVASPDYVQSQKLHAPEDMGRAALIHHAHRMALWHLWFDSLNLPAEHYFEGSCFDQFLTIIEAAAGGLGVGLVPAMFVREELASGRLVALFDYWLPSTDAYFLVTPKSKENDPLVGRFTTWILSEAASEGRNDGVMPPSEQLAAVVNRPLRSLKSP